MQPALISRELNSAGHFSGSLSDARPGMSGAP